MTPTHPSHSIGKQVQRLRLRYRRCGYCGRRDRHHRAFTVRGWWSWTTCRRCQPSHDGFADELLPPPYATPSR